MVCEVKLGTYPNFTDGHIWKIHGDGHHGMERNDDVESWYMSGCENSSVVFYEHGDPNQRQQAHVLTNGPYQRYNEAKWINTHGPYASPLNGVSAVKIQTIPGESLKKGGTINATVHVPDGQGPRVESQHTVSNWDNYLKPNEDGGLNEHCPGATWKKWKHAKSAGKSAQALCQWKIEESNMASLGASDKTHVKGVYNTIKTRVCDAIKNDHPNFKTGTGDEKCWDRVNTQDFMKDYCFKDNRMADDPLCSDTSLGDSYAILADEYCKKNPDKEFCKCYNVVNYETICANRGTSKGCPAAKEAYDKYVEFKIPQPIVWLPCGDACKGNVYKPDGYEAGCSGTIAACIQNIEVGAAHDEINAACEINTGEGNELTSGSSGDSSGSGGSGGSGGSTSVPLSTTQTSDLENTVAEMKKEKEEEKEEAKKTKKKLIIGGGGGGIVSSISFLMLIVLIVMVMSKKGGGRRRR
jgi:hypothetical protein